MSKYNHSKNELELRSKVAQLAAKILELYSQKKITEEVKNILLKEIKIWI